jgi:pimeloyl-ACP methyl ester carboxylesterase
MWRHVAADLVADHTVICPDLRGYGASDKPAAADEATYAKRTMAADIVALAGALGHERFTLAGHDRGDRDAGNQLRMPVTVLRQDWGAALGFDSAALWDAWAPDLRHSTVSYGHLMAEEAPADIAKEIRELLSR